MPGWVRRKLVSELDYIKHEAESKYSPAIIVTRDGDKYIAVNEKEDVIASGSDAATILDYAIRYAHETGYQTVEIAGPINLRTVTVSAPVRLIVNGTIYAESTPLFVVKSSNVAIEGGYIIGNGRGAAIVIDNVDNVKITNSYITKFGTAIAIVGRKDHRCHRIKVARNTIVYNIVGIWAKYTRNLIVSGNSIASPVNPPYSFGIHVDLSWDLIISGNSVTGGDIAIHVSSSRYGSIVGNSVCCGRGGGIALAGDNYHVVISGNSVHNMQKEGIEIRNLHYGVVSGNTLHDNGYSGIRIFRSTRTVVEGNIVSDCGFNWAPGAEHPAYSQLEILNDSDSDIMQDLLIVNNKIVNIRRVPAYQVYISPYPGKRGLPGGIRFVGNTFGRASRSTVYVRGRSIVFRENEGFVTEDYGSVSVQVSGSDDVAIAKHRLSVKVHNPGNVIVTCTPINSDAVRLLKVCYLADDDGDGVYESVHARLTTAPSSATLNIAYSVIFVGDVANP